MDFDWQKNASLLGDTTGLSQEASSGNSTFMVINEFRFLAARSIRTSTIILAAFNTVSAFATAAGILFDCYLTAKRSQSRRNERVNIFKCVRATETFPFILSLGITVQGIIFAVSQSHGLDGLFKSGCSVISQFMWPALFIVPYIQLIFGLEVTFRGLRTEPFPRRGKWDVVICLVVIKVLLVLTGLVAIFIRAPNFCFASLFWFVAKWAEGAFALLLIITIVLASCIAVIYSRLTRTSMIEDTERVNASRMVYYLVVAVLSNALVVPFFGNLTFSDPMDSDNDSGLTLSMVSSVVANLSGLLTGGLYLFLRSSTISTIGPRDKLADYERQKLKHKIRLWGPSGMDFNDHIMQPVAGPRSVHKMGSQESLVIQEKGEDFELEPSQKPRGSNHFTSNGVNDLDSIATPMAPEPAQISSTLPARTHSHRPSTSYSLFPNKNQTNTDSVMLLPSTTYSPNSNNGSAEPGFAFSDPNSTLKPPPAIGSGGHHRRQSSLASSATVQIGLRFSNVEDFAPMASKPSIEVERVNSLDYPNKEASTHPLRPSPLARTQQAESVTSSVGGNSPKSAPETMKSLPPVPAPSPTREQNDRTLSPSVYSPHSMTNQTKGKITSPKGVGFSSPRRVNTTPEETSAKPAPLRIRGQSDADKGRTNWI